VAGSGGGGVVSVDGVVEGRGAVGATGVGATGAVISDGIIEEVVPVVPCFDGAVIVPPHCFEGAVIDCPDTYDWAEVTGP
jgi:hypothetical protein